jgi:hypothetical protein
MAAVMIAILYACAARVCRPGYGVDVVVAAVLTEWRGMVEEFSGNEAAAVLPGDFTELRRE